MSPVTSFNPLTPGHLKMSLMDLLGYDHTAGIDSLNTDFFSACLFILLIKCDHSETSA